MRRISRYPLLVLTLSASAFLAAAEQQQRPDSARHRHLQDRDQLGSVGAREMKNDVVVINGPRFQLRMMLDLTPTGLVAPYAVAFSNDDDPATMHPRPPRRSP